MQAAYAQVNQARQDKAQAAAQAASAASQALAALGPEAARLREEAQAYRRRVIAEALAESEQFATLLPEYQKAPQATRERLYYETMQQVFGRMRKVVVDGQPGQPIHVSFDGKALAAAAPASATNSAAASASSAASAASAASAVAATASQSASSSEVSSAGGEPASNLRSRDPARLRERP